MGVHYSPDYILKFQLKSTNGLQNFLKFDDPLFRVEGKTLSGYSEYNVPGLNSSQIKNWFLRGLSK